jgi:hypothetical protein
MGIRKGLTMDSLKCHAQPFYALQAGHSYNGFTAVSGVACLQGKRPVAVFYPFGHPSPYAYVSILNRETKCVKNICV